MQPRTSLSKFAASRDEAPDSCRQSGTETSTQVMKTIIAQYDASELMLRRDQVSKAIRKEVSPFPDIFRVFYHLVSSRWKLASSTF